MGADEVESGSYYSGLALGPHGHHIPVIIAIESYDSGYTPPMILKELGPLFPLEHDLRAGHGTRAPQHCRLDPLTTAQLDKTLTRIVPKLIPKVKFSRWV